MNRWDIAVGSKTRNSFSLCPHCDIIMTNEEPVMTIVPIRDLRNTSEISEMVHKSNEPVFVTKNGYGDMVIMSLEHYEALLSERRIDLAIQKAEKEIESGGKLLSAEEVKEALYKKHYGSL